MNIGRDLETVVPALVSEGDPRIEAHFVALERDGVSTPAYVAAPRQAGATASTLVMAMHLTGVDEEQRATARRFAAAGFVTIVPDLYARFQAPDGDVADAAAFLPFAQRLRHETVEPVIRAAAGWARDCFAKSRLAIVGFCMGGMMAMRRSAGHADTFAAAALWYGFAPDVDPRDVDIPLVASYGAADSHIPVAPLQEFQRGLPVANDVKIYPGAAHAFFDYRRPSYDGAAAADSWQRTISFLNVHLRG